MEEQITPEELKKELEEAKAQRDEYLAGWQRARADFLNHKKEERERMQEFIKFAEEELLSELLPIVDNLELALVQLEGKEDAVSKGFSQIAIQLKSFLKDHEVQELKAKGERFNPEFHEAAEEVEKEGTEPGTVVEVLSKGYTLHGKLLRPAKVRIAK
ncbi:MAG: nucleotide exchange factor GrpE [Candidatus Wildermuthbacteria bacterium RIFCSPHIGHO2_02_FULL_47_12]|uniref:Protein GrpE n=2 Tax=Parcubacteria group TaxID=1794811 RepID=A0A1G2R4Z7_9BACT|nr:MAG: nucleotide exchange factor GrpE [Candidatus Buchananbacteria bacterium RIFCSPLOWO2_01_FULL_46_12]OHA67940.1 MAG: nucleotide exchange factor GrpE [Candidatus Wildermuthbacteria bacterium RIFCSPHIGHO2_02_FULL_47_12]